MMSNIACFLHLASCHDLRTLIVNVGFSVVCPYYDVEVDLCLCFCSVCNNFIGPVLLSRSYIWHWYWLHRCIVSSICHEFDNISLMVSESVMYSTSMVDDALDCILGVLLPIVEIRPCSEACIASSSILLLYVLASCWICYVSLLGCVVVIKRLTVAHSTTWAYVSSWCWLLDDFLFLSNTGW